MADKVIKTIITQVSISEKPIMIRMGQKPPQSEKKYCLVELVKRETPMTELTIQGHPYNIKKAFNSKEEAENYSKKHSIQIVI